MQFFTDLGSRYLDYTADVFLVLFDPTQRIFWLYLLTSAIFAYFVYRHGARKMQRDGHGEDAPKSFIGYLFPKQVWVHPSAWLDVRYFFFHKLIGHFLIFGLLMMMMGQSFSWITGESLLEFINRTAHVTSPWWVSVVYMLVVIAVIDFVGFYIHYLQHKIPILWEFHKVHHSAEVMHPMSNFREHPIDNLAYQAFTGLGYGISMGVMANILGHLPPMPSLLGVPVLMFAFNIFGYNLRHSHIWLKWPGVWSKVFPSPAHHHVHHSMHPDHFDKNFAFIFPVWDVLFGTYIMPDDNRDVKFGVAGMKSMEMDSCWKLYWIPFRKAGRRLTKPKKAVRSKP